MRTIAVVNQKGGCGKTITSINLAAFLAREQKRVLLVDMDPQGHATLGLSNGSGPTTRTIAEIFVTEPGRPPTRLGDVTHSARENLDLAPADILLSAIPPRLAGVAGGENILAENLAELTPLYDFAIIDCPPNVGLLTFNALKACAEAIVPMDPSFFSLHGIGKQLETFAVVQKQTGHRITPRVLLTLYPGRSPFVRAVADDVFSHLVGRHFETIIRYSVKLAEAASHGLPIADYCRQCVGFEDYQALTEEVLRLDVAGPMPEPVKVAEEAPLHDEEDTADRPSSPTMTREGVLFTLEAPAAARVQLAGDFNDWALDGNEMSSTGGIWTATVKLPPGRYRYRYVVDGSWQNDPSNPLIEACPYGGHDSILVLDQKSGE